MRFSRLIPVLLLLVACLSARAQAPHSFSRYGRENGFAGTTVEDMVQDGHGQLWLATWGGLYSFDGRTFQNYKTNIPDDRDNSRSNRFVDVEAFDRDEIRVVSYDNRLYSLDKEARALVPMDCRGHGIQQIFRPTEEDCFYLTPDNEVLDATFSHYCTVSRNATVHTIIRDPEGQIWILTDQGIYRSGAQTVEVPTFCAEVVDSALYIGTSGGEVLRYRDQLLTPLPTQLNTDVTFIAKVPGKPELLIGSDTQGIEIHNLEDDSHRHLPLVNTSDEDGSFTCRADILGNLWIYSSRGSLYWYDGEAYELVPFLNKNMQQGWNSETGITSFLADRQGNLWIGSTWGGLERVTFQEDNFKFKTIDGSGRISPENSVRALVQEPSGWILAATRDGRLHAFDESLQERTSWFTRQPGYAITITHDGKIWVGTRGAGLVEFTRTPGDLSQSSVHQVHHPKNDLFYGPNSNDIYSLLEDGTQRLWIGTFDEGLAYVDLSLQDRLFISKKNRLSFPTDRRNRIRCLALGPDGRLYAGGQIGLFVCEQPSGEPEDMHFERFTQILDYDIQHILFTREGELYVSSFGAGLLHFDSANPDSGFKAFTIDDGMLSDYILSTIEDDAGNLWIATQGGLNRLNLQTGSLIGFPYDRIGHPMRFNEGQPLRARDGSLYFNTTAGILYFDPKEISNNDFVPELVIQAFYISGIRQPLAEGGTVRILPSDGIRLQFAAVDLTAPEQVLYSYKLDGRDKEWIPLGHQATISIPPLRPGKYTLRIRSTTGNGLEVDNEKDFVIAVHNTFLHSGWAGLLFVLLSVGVVFLVTRTRRKDLDQSAPAEDPLLERLHGDDRRFVEDFRTFLVEHLDDGSLEVPQMCEAMNVSRSVLFEKCRTLLDTTPAIYLRHLRLERAKTLIREGGRTMADISYAVGFNDPHYFSKIFKQEFGQTPTGYRASLKEENASTAANQPEAPGKQPGA